MEGTSGFNSSDLEWVNIAREVPGGFAGIYLSNDGDLILRLKYPNMKSQTISALVTRQAAFLPTSVRLENAKVESARWDFAQLFEWARYIVPRMGEIPSSIDLDEVHNRIALTTAPTKVAAVKESLTKLSLPAGLVSVEAQSQICLSDMVPAIRIWAKDSLTGKSITPGAQLTIESRAFTETTAGTQGMPDSPLEAGVGKVGVFNVIVRQSGYNDWHRDNLNVKFDGCHPLTVEITALLIPKTAN